MALNYTVYQYDGKRNVAARLVKKSLQAMVSIAMRPGGLQDYVDVWNELN